MARNAWILLFEDGSIISQMISDMEPKYFIFSIEGKFLNFT